MARNLRKEGRNRRKNGTTRKQSSLPSLDSLSSLTNDSMNMFVDRVLQKQGVALKKPQLSMQEKRQLRNLLMELQEKVEALSKTTEQ